MEEGKSLGRSNNKIKIDTRKILPFVSASMKAMMKRTRAMTSPIIA